MINPLDKATELLQEIPQRQPESFGRWHNMLEDDLKKELLFCLITRGTRQKILGDFYDSKIDSLFQSVNSKNQKEIESILRERKIRFHQVKAKSLLGYGRNLEIKKILEEIGHWSGKDLQHERWARSIMITHLRGHGIWLKEASLFLKMIGFSKFLVPLDSRHIKFLNEINLYPNLKADKLNNIDIYFDIEDKENLLAQRLNLALPELDNRICDYIGD